MSAQDTNSRFTTTGNKPANTNIKLFWTLQVLLAVCATAAFFYMHNHRSQAYRAAETLNRGLQLSTRIEQLQSNSSSRPVDLPDARLAELIEQNAGSSGIRPQSIRLISPQPPARIGQSRYGRKNTLVRLKDVTVRHTAEMIFKLNNPHSANDDEAEQTPLKALSLRLTNPNNESPTESWNAEVEFSQTVLIPDISTGTNQ